MRKIIVIGMLLTACLVAGLSVFPFAKNSETKTTPGDHAGLTWVVPDTSSIPADDDGLMIRYGRELVANTSGYLGVHGSRARISNGLNCQSCHLQAGTGLWANNFGAVASLYPKFRARSGSRESIEKKINDCFERSMNGKALDSNSYEMQAMVSYIRWLGASVPKDQKPVGSGLRALPFMDRAADPAKGGQVFVRVCASCHGKDGQGQWNEGGRTYRYPPLWGEHSYNTGAGIYRIAKLAAFVRDNMPYGTTYANPMLTVEEAWDVAAFVNSQPRPGMDLGEDWPDIGSKPVDHPFGPYADPFSEQQHKFGPFKPIDAFRAKNK